jgi:hypothetical protein
VSQSQPTRPRVEWSQLTVAQRRVIRAMPADGDPAFIETWWRIRTPVNTLKVLIERDLVYTDYDAGLDRFGRPRYALTAAGLAFKPRRL